MALFHRKTRANEGGCNADEEPGGPFLSSSALGCGE
jgi:hypothetical protein